MSGRSSRGVQQVKPKISKMELVNGAGSKKEKKHAPNLCAQQAAEFAKVGFQKIHYNRRQPVANVGDSQRLLLS